MREEPHDTSMSEVGMDLHAPVMGYRVALLLGPALMDEGSSSRQGPGRSKGAYRHT